MWQSEGDDLYRGYTRTITVLMENKKEIPGPLFGGKTWDLEFYEILHTSS